MRRRSALLSGTTQFPGSSLEGNAGSAASRAIGGALGPAAGAVASAIGGAVSAVASAVAGIAAAASGNQRRNGFRCIVESVKQKFTLFSPGRHSAAGDIDGGDCANTKLSTSNSRI